MGRRSMSPSSKERDWRERSALGAVSPSRAEVGRPTAATSGLPASIRVTRSLSRPALAEPTLWVASAGGEGGSVAADGEGVAIVSASRAALLGAASTAMSREGPAAAEGPGEPMSSSTDVTGARIRRWSGRVSGGRCMSRQAARSALDGGGIELLPGGAIGAGWVRSAFRCGMRNGSDARMRSSNVRRPRRRPRGSLAGGACGSDAHVSSIGNGR